MIPYSEDPSITVYITNYNYGKFIRQSIESVLSQTRKDFELIIIDDGSIDNSRNIIEEYQSHPQIQIIFQQNKGLNVTNNIALRAARGRYIVRLDADDFFREDALEKLAYALDSDSELGLVFPDYYYVDEQGEILEEFKRHNFKEEVSLLDQAAHGACTMIRTDFLKKLGGYNESFSCQDGYELWVKFTANYKVANVGFPLFYYRRHGSNLTHNETRILSTRARINQLYSTNRFGNIRSVAIIPVRDDKIALRTLGDKALLQYKIDAALQSKSVEKVVISSTLDSIARLIASEYDDNAKVVFHKRVSALERLNVPLAATARAILNDFYSTKNFPEAIIMLTIEFPFTASYIIDDAVNTLFLFESDSLIGVRQEGRMFFQHLGNGMHPILDQDKIIKLEREALYTQAGGITVTRTDRFQESEKLLTGKIGHIMVDQLSAFGLFSDFDFQLAELLVKQQMFLPEHKVIA
ncbi:MAG: glycosyltransferase [Chitinophagaceae bacterium]|nr:glycosyltransferase [Chitinophagaceae bacterium]